MLSMISRVVVTLTKSLGRLIAILNGVIGRETVAVGCETVAIAHETVAIGLETVAISLAILEINRKIIEINREIIEINLEIIEINREIFETVECSCNSNIWSCNGCTTNWRLPTTSTLVDGRGRFICKQMIHLRPPTIKIFLETT